MKMKIINRPALIAGLLAGLALPVLAGENGEKEDGQTVAWKDVPAAVQSTITANASGGTVAEVETETEKGAMTYEAEVKGTDGREIEIKVAADGKLIKAKAEKQDKEGDNEDNDNDGK